MMVLETGKKSLLTDTIKRALHMREEMQEAGFPPLPSGQPRYLIKAEGGHVQIFSRGRLVADVTTKEPAKYVMAFNLRQAQRSGGSLSF